MRESTSERILREELERKLTKRQNEAETMSKEQLTFEDAEIKRLEDMYMSLVEHKDSTKTDRQKVIIDAAFKTAGVGLVVLGYIAEASYGNACSKILSNLANKIFKI